MMNEVRIRSGNWEVKVLGKPEGALSVLPEDFLFNFHPREAKKELKHLHALEQELHLKF